MMEKRQETREKMKRQRLLLIFLFNIEFDDKSDWFPIWSETTEERQKTENRMTFCHVQHPIDSF